MIPTSSLEGFASRLLDRHVYVANADDPTCPATMPLALAWTGRSLDLVLRDWLTDSGQWVGRGPAIAFSPKRVAEHGANPHAVVLHELAHIAQRGVDESESTERSVEMAHAFASLSSKIAEQRESEELTTVLPSSHDATFLRLCCHLHRRARYLGIHCPLNEIVVEGAYQLPPIGYAYDALNGEPDHFIDMSIFNVPTADEPAPYRRLFDEYNA